MSTTRFEVGVNLNHPEGETAIPVTMHFELEGNKLVGVKGVGADGAEYNLSFIIRARDGGDGCWICDEPPCPPNKLHWYNPCPMGGVKPQA
jgi:hypothetical protein